MGARGTKWIIRPIATCPQWFTVEHLVIPSRMWRWRLNQHLTSDVYNQHTNNKRKKVIFKTRTRFVWILVLMLWQLQDPWRQILKAGKVLQSTNLIPTQKKNNNWDFGSKWAEAVSFTFGRAASFQSEWKEIHFSLILHNELQLQQRHRLQIIIKGCMYQELCKKTA